MDFDKDFATTESRKIYQPFPPELSAIKCSLSLYSDKFWVNKRSVFLPKPTPVKPTDKSFFFIFQCITWIFSIEKAQYCFSAFTDMLHHVCDLAYDENMNGSIGARKCRSTNWLINYMYHSSDMSFLVTLTLILSRTLITLSFKTLLLTDWGDTLYFYIVPSTILISVIYFDFINYQGIIL